MSCAITAARSTPIWNKPLRNALVCAAAALSLVACLPRLLCAQEAVRDYRALTDEERGVYIEECLRALGVEETPEPPAAAREAAICHELEWWENLYTSVGMQTGFATGDTIYHISFDNPWESGGHGESQLSWPIHNYLIGVEASLSYRLNASDPVARDRARLRFSWFTNLDDASGKMKDSDWIENDVGYLGGGENHDSYDIFSTSDCTLDRAHLWDVSYVYNFWPVKSIGIGPLLGLRYQTFEFHASNLQQDGFYSYYPDFSYHDNRNLRWGDYESRQTLPYLGINTDVHISDTFFLNLGLGYSDWARIRDEDTHRYPTADEALGGNYDMVSKTSADGSVFLSSVKAGWRFLPNWAWTLGANYLTVSAKGNTVQRTYYNNELLSATDGGAINTRVTCEYWLIDTSLRCSF